MIYEDACRALGILPDVFALPVTDNRAKVEVINTAFRRAIKRAHPDTRIEDGGPTVEQIKEARTLLIHSVSDECPTCRGLTFVKTFGNVKQCPTCKGTGRVTP